MTNDEIQMSIEIKNSKFQTKAFWYLKFEFILLFVL